MKKVICLMVCLLMCLSLTMPVQAASDAFVPSITYKETPAVGNVVLDIPEEVLEAEDVPEEIVEKIEEKGDGFKILDGCIVLTSITQAEKALTDITQEARDTLLDLYEELKQDSGLLLDVLLEVTEQIESSDIVPEGSETVADDSGKKPDGSGKKPDDSGKESDKSGKKFWDFIKNPWGSNKKSENSEKKSKARDYVVLQLVDISFQQHHCVDSRHWHHEALEQEHTSVTMDFDLGVAPDVDVVVLTYNDKKWTPIKSVVNNGDGTVTCVFEHFCPVAFCVEVLEEEAAEGELALSDLIPWILALIMSFVLFVIVIIDRKKEHK